MKLNKRKIHEIIFEADTKAGKLFDVILIILICLSVAVVMVESVSDLNAKYNKQLEIGEWILTFLFLAEFLFRTWSVNKPQKYLFSFFGIIDFLSILPSFIGLFVTGASSLLIIRSLRLIRVFRVLKLSSFIGEGNQLMDALKASRAKIIVFLVSILILIIILGTIMYLVEGTENGFTSIPRSVYWAVVTLTTVGYGDIAPHTTLGQFIASVVMILGYGIIAVPTGIVTKELLNSEKISLNTEACINCGLDMHDNDANYCKKCGYKLKNHEKSN